MPRFNKRSSRLSIKPAKQDAVINSPRVASPYALTCGQLTENVVFHHPKMGLSTKSANVAAPAPKPDLETLRSMTLLATILEGNTGRSEDRSKSEEEPWWKVLVDRRNDRASKTKQGGHTVEEGSSNDTDYVIAKGTVIIISSMDGGQVDNAAGTINTATSQKKKNEKNNRKAKKESTTLSEPVSEDVSDITIEAAEERLNAVEEQTLVVPAQTPCAAEIATPPVLHKDGIGDDRARARRVRSDSITFLRQRTASRTASLSSRSSIRMSSPAGGMDGNSATSEMTPNTNPSGRRSESRDTIDEMRKRIQVDGTGSELDHLFVRAADHFHAENTPPYSLTSESGSASAQSPLRSSSKDSKDSKDSKGSKDSKDSIKVMRERVQLHGTGSKLDHLFLKAADQLKSEQNSNSSPPRIASPQSTGSSGKRAAALNPLAEVFVPLTEPEKGSATVKPEKAVSKPKETVYTCRYCAQDLRDSEPGTLLCNGCGPFSRVRYCSLDCMFLDFNDHWTICNEKRMSFPIRLPASSSEKRGFIPAIQDRWGYNSPARLRQQLWSMHRHQECDYALFGDRIPWMETGVPCSSTEPTRVIAVPDGSLKDIINRLLNAAFSDHYQPEILLLLFRMIRKGLNQGGYWNPKIAEDLMFQFGVEFGINARLAEPTDPDLAREWYGRGGLERVVRAMEDANPILRDCRRDRPVKR